MKYTQIYFTLTMTSMMRKISKNNRGFTALIAVILVSSGIIALSLVVMSHAVSYSDMVIKKEYRIRRSLELEACLDSLKIMAIKNKLLNGRVFIHEFHCEGYVENDLSGEKVFRVKSI